jgi:hypothetical protein
VVLTRTAVDAAGAAALQARLPAAKIVLEAAAE